jgi:CHAT domain-containing protein/Tfp pilus assembly protein PilF
VDIDMFDGIGAGDRLGKARELMQSGDLDGALAAVERVIGLGKSVEALELKSEILGAIVGRNRVVPEMSAEEWSDRGVALVNPESYDAALKSFEQALAIDPTFFPAHYGRGVALSGLGHHKESIEAYDYVLTVMPDLDDAWRYRGHALHNLGLYEDAIISYKKAISASGNDSEHLHEIWRHIGFVYRDLGFYQEEIESYSKATSIEASDYQSWTSLGLALSKLGCDEKALLSYDEALRYKSSFPLAWAGRGSALDSLGRYEEAIDCFDEALKHQPEFHGVWNDRSITAFNSISIGQDNVLTRKHPELNQRGYPGALASLTIGLRYCPADIDALGYGTLWQKMGDTHWVHARSQSSPRPYRRQALKAYEASLGVLTASDHPEERLQTLQKLIRTHDALREIAPDAMLALLRQGTELRTRILTQARSDEQRERLTRTLPNFNELTVDFHLSQGDNIAAIETAEADKNGLMQWLLPVPGTANYAEMRETIGVDTAIVYWYLGANAIATFVLRADQAEPIIVTEFDREISLKMRDRLDEWIKVWNKNYTSSNVKSKDSDIESDHTWRNTLSAQLADLAEILDIAKLLPHLQNIHNLILVPHRDLHRFPLHTFFPQAKITYLPSLHLGRHLRPAQRVTQAQLLSIEAPAHNGAKLLAHAGIESEVLRYLYPSHIYLAPDQSDQSTFLQSIAQPHTHLHFNGHANHNPDNPKQSELMLRGDDTLTLNTFRQSPYYPSQIVTLAACETGITNAQTITAEYVGWVSAFLSRDVPHVLSTLWTVHSEATALFMMQFYRQLQCHHSPVIAHHQAQQWLRHLTVGKLTRLYQTALPHQTGAVFDFIETELLNLGKMEESALPYADPYYWAAFILSGRPNSL